MEKALDLFREFIALDRKRGRGLTASEFQRWVDLKRQLAREFQPEVTAAQADRRASIRVPTKLAVTFGDLGELQRCWLKNLSRGGVFVSTPKVVAIGTRLTLRISIAENGEEIDVPAEVVSHNLGPQFQRQRGMGLRFIDVPADVQKKLDDLYESALGRVLGRDR